MSRCPMPMPPAFASSDVLIRPLADGLDHVLELASWHHAQFGYLNPALTLAQRIDRLVAGTRSDELPLTWIAVADGCLLGSASLVASTIVHPHLWPWLSSVYVAPPHRGRGRGSALVRHVEQAARQRGFQRLHLFTPDREAMYARLGWTFLENAMHSSHRITIMARGLSSPNSVADQIS